MIVFMTPGSVHYKVVEELKFEVLPSQEVLLVIPGYRVRLSEAETSRLRANVKRIEFQVRGDRHITCHFSEHGNRCGYFHYPEGEESWYIWIQGSHEAKQGFGWRSLGSGEILITGSRRDIFPFSDVLNFREMRKLPVVTDPEDRIFLDEPPT